MGVMKIWPVLLLLWKWDIFPMNWKAKVTPCLRVPNMIRWRFPDLENAPWYIPPVFTPQNPKSQLNFSSRISSESLNMKRYSKSEYISFRSWLFRTTAVVLYTVEKVVFRIFSFVGALRSKYDLKLLERLNYNTQQLSPVLSSLNQKL